MIKHLKIFVRGVKAMWEVWLLLAYIIIAGFIGDTVGLVMLTLPIIGFLAAGVYIVGMGKSK